jgi:hypothetical protein
MESPPISTDEGFGSPAEARGLRVHNYYNGLFKNEKPFLKKSFPKDQQVFTRNLGHCADSPVKGPDSVSFYNVGKPVK